MQQAAEAVEQEGTVLHPPAGYIEKRAVETAGSSKSPIAASPRQQQAADGSKQRREIRQQPAVEDGGGGKVE